MYDVNDRPYRFSSASDKSVPENAFAPDAVLVPDHAHIRDLVREQRNVVLNVAGKDLIAGRLESDCTGAGVARAISTPKLVAPEVHSSGAEN